MFDSTDKGNGCYLREPTLLFMYLMSAFPCNTVKYLV